MPSTSHTRGPSARATKYGVPPTDRNARTGEFTPPGMTRWARSNSDSSVRSSPQRFGGFAGEVGEDEVGAGPLDRGEVLHGDGRPSIQPRSAAALTIAYSPDTWYAAEGHVDLARGPPAITSR